MVSERSEYGASGPDIRACTSIRCSVLLPESRLLNLGPQLRSIDNQSLATARLLSRRLDAIAVPIKYETVRLNDRIIAPEAETAFPLALDRIYVFTRHIEARSNLDPQGIKQVLDRIQRLSSVRYRSPDQSALPFGF